METIEHVLPQKYGQWIPVLIVLIPMLGRAWYAIINGGGLRGLWRSLIFGSTTVHNDPKPPAPPAPPTKAP